MLELVSPPSAKTRRRFATCVVVATLAPVVGLGVSTGSAQAGAEGVDVQSFSARAVAWSRANIVHQAAATERAIELGERAAAAEAEADRIAAAAVTASTTVPSTTVPSTTVPSTTVPPATGAPVETTAPIDATTTIAASGRVPTPDQWEALRQCESSGRYDALSPGGRYRGAYQFSQATWDWVAGWANPGLVGTDPAAASVADQDAQAQALYDRQGSGPWPTCGRYLP